MNFEFLKIQHQHKLAEISLNRPSKANALNETLWFELAQALVWADKTPEVRAVIVRGEGSHFCAGIDFEFLHSMSQRFTHFAEGRKQEALRDYIRSLQQAFTTAERCRKPVLAAIHGSCIGGAVDFITACDIRYASLDARFCVKEIDLGIVADIGTLQRLPSIIGEGRTRELALTARIFNAEEAQAIGLVNQTAASPAELWELVRDQARNIASKSPLAVRGTKQVLNYNRDHSIEAGLDYVATWNAGMLFSEDLKLAIEALMQRKQAEFPD